MAETNASKACAKCKGVFPLSMFNKNKSKWDGLGTECRPCANAHSKKYAADNPEAHNARGRNTYQRNKEVYKERAREWARENNHKVKERAALYRLLNGEKIKEASKNDWAKHNEKRLAAKKAYRDANPERGAEHVRARQTRKQRAMPVWADRDAIRAIYKECARINKETGIRHHVDHYYPLKNSLVCGLHCEYNLRILPAASNQSKGNSFPMEEL